MRQETYDNLVGHIYNSALAQDGLQPFIEALTHALHAESAVLRLLDLDSNEIFFLEHYNYNPAFAGDYANYYVKLDIFNQHARNIDIGHVIRSQNVISDRELIKTELYNDYMRRLGRFHIAGTCVQRHGSKVALLSAQRGKQAGAFTEQETGLLNKLTPHLNRALAISQRLEQLSHQHLLLSRELDQIPIGLIFLDASGNINDLNARATALIAAHPLLCIRHKRLSIQHHELNKQLESMVQGLIELSQHKSVASKVDNALCIPGGNKTRAIHILSSPLTKHLPQRPSLEMQDSIGVLVLGTPEARHSIPNAILKTLYGLSEAEGCLLNTLATGADLSEACQQLAISPNTARTQLKSIFRKTGVNRQAELIKLVFTSPASLYLKRTP